jgi:hypothetical protein
MQIKTIQKIIEKKLNDWISSITDLSLQQPLRDNVLLSGGSICSMLLGEDVNDFDIYIIDRNVLMDLVKYYTQSYSSDIEVLDGRKREEYKSKIDLSYKHINNLDSDNVIAAYPISVRNLKEDQIKLFFHSKDGGMKVNQTIEEDKLNYTPLFFSPNAISLSNKIQIVIRFHGNVEEIHKTFDFIHATNFFTFKDGLVTNKRALESIITKQLQYQGSLYPVTSIIRSKKFTKRNWNINAGELMKIMFQISKLDLSNPDILEEQLIGVDVAYFDLLITALRNKYESDKDFKLSNEYFNTLVDKIFQE